MPDDEPASVGVNDQKPGAAKIAAIATPSADFRQVLVRAMKSSAKPITPAMTTRIGCH